MKLLHLSDLHLGKRVNGFSMLEDQVYILSQILDIVQREKPHCILIAGDIYDRSVPAMEAVGVLDDFLVSLSHEHIPVFIISGNHDSAERLAFGSRLMKSCQLHISPVYDGTLTPITLEDDHGPVDFYLLPFVKPSQLRHLLGDDSIETYTDAVSRSLAAADVDKTHRNVLLTHHFVTGAQRCDSEELSVGGMDNVDACVFADFDYVALGHLHGPQSVQRSTIRYCGSPLKYSFSEANQKKSVTVVNLHEKGNVECATVPLQPLRDMVELRGSYLELTAKTYYDGLDCQAYIRVILTDENDVPDAIGRLRNIYPNLMRLDYDNLRTRAKADMPLLDETKNLSPMDMANQLYTQQNGGPMSPEQEAYLSALIAEIWEECL